MRISDARRLIVAAVLLIATSAVPAGSFEEAHPDQFFRLRGAKLVAEGKTGAALEDFKAAARYGDKPSQLALALAHWNGEGVAADRALGYIWADLAAERGVPAFVSVRERMWNQMTEEERARAVEQGRDIAQEYEDKVAMPRMTRKLRAGQRQRTGTRTGSSVYSTGVTSVDPSSRAAMASDIYSAILNNVGPTGDAGIDQDGNAIFGNSKPEPSSSVVGGSYSANMVRQLGVAFQASHKQNSIGYYNPENWDPKLYFKARDAPWRDLPVGAVTVGPLRKKDG